MDLDVTDLTAEEPATQARSRMSGLLRATQVLDHLVVEGRATSAYDLAKAIRAPVSTIYGVVDALVQAGLLERDANGAVWFGSRMYHYGLAYGRNVDLLREARTEMRRLAEELGETVQLCGRHEGHVVILDMAEAARSLRVSNRIGARVPINWSVSGRFFLTHLAAAEQLQIFREYAQPSATGVAPVDPAQFLSLIKEAQGQGFASQLSGTDTGVACIAAPVNNTQDICEITISIVMPEARLGEALETYADAVRGAAAQIEKRVGWRAFSAIPEIRRGLGSPTPQVTAERSPSYQAVA